ncbi:hypothetical protein V3C99_006205 [Haemonchus contortus]
MLHLIVIAYQQTRSPRSYQIFRKRDYFDPFASLKCRARKKAKQR